MRSFTPTHDARTDGGPTGEWPVAEPMAQPLAPPPVPDAIPAHVANEPSPEAPRRIAVETVDPEDIDDRFIVEDTLRSDEGETVVVAHDVLCDGMPRVLVQRWSRTSVAATDGVIDAAVRRAAVQHPAVAPVQAVLRTATEVVVVYGRPSTMRLDRWVDDDGPLERALALQLVDQIADGLGALRAGGIERVPLTPARIGLRWSAPGAWPEAAVCELEPVERPCDPIAELCDLLAFCLTGATDGRVPGRALRAFIAQARDPHAGDRPPTVEAFRARLGAVQEADKASSGRRGLWAAAVLLLGAGVGGGWWLTRPEPPPDTREPMVVEFSAATDEMPPPPPLSDQAPLGEAHAKISARVSAGLAGLDTLRHADRKPEAKRLLGQLGDALDGRPPTSADRASVALAVERKWYGPAIAAARDELASALAAGDKEQLSRALHHVYALNPTHVGAAFARRNDGDIHLIEEHR